MAKPSKRTRAIEEKIGDGRVPRPPDDALQALKDVTTTKFDETIDVAVNLGVDPRKSEQAVRGATVLPNGTGKQVRVALFADGDDAEAGRTAGADIVGMDDLAEAVKGGELNFDVAIATPDSMRVVGQLGQVLGPRGLMPNPRLGTVTMDVGEAVRNAKAGQVRYRTDKNGIVHGGIGKVGFESAAIKENIEALIADLKKAKPTSAKGTYVKKVVLSTTMGAGIPIDQASLEM